MPARRSIDERVGALERRLDDDSTVQAGAERDAAQPAAVDYEALRERIDSLEAAVADLEAGLQAVRGYVGNVEHVNESVQRRADAALAAVERIEAAPKTPPPIATAAPEERIPAATAAEEFEDTPEDESPGVIEQLRTLR